MVLSQDQEKLYQFVQEHDQNTELIADINNCLESFAVAEVLQQYCTSVYFSVWIEKAELNS